jgi:hypothetical protein
VHSVSHNGHAIGQPAANKFDDSKTEIQPKGGGYIARLRTMMMVMVTKQAMGMRMLIVIVVSMLMLWSMVVIAACTMLMGFVVWL